MGLGLNGHLNSLPDIALCSLFSQVTWRPGTVPSCTVMLAMSCFHAVVCTKEVAPVGCADAFAEHAFEGYGVLRAAGHGCMVVYPYMCPLCREMKCAL